MSEPPRDADRPPSTRPSSGEGERPSSEGSPSQPPGDERASERPRSERPSEGPEHRRRRLERILPEVLRRAFEKGLESSFSTLTNSSEALKGVVGDYKLPKEIVGYIFSQIDETKNAMVRVVAGEVRDFLAATDLSQELQRALTSLSFEIRTEIRFIPNDKGGVRPEVKSEVEPKKDKARPSDD